MNAKDLKEHGYTHVLVEIERFDSKPTITKVFKSRKEVQTFLDRLSLHEMETRIFDIYTINKAIKKGY